MKVIENKVTSRFGILAGQFRNVSGIELQSAGINTVTIQNSRLGSVTIYDLAGRFEYYSSHDALVENRMCSSRAIFIVVVKLNESEAKVMRTLRYWITFTENICSRVKCTPHLMVVGSWADKVEEAIDQKWLNMKTCIPSSSRLNLRGFTALDCRKMASSGLDEICDMLGSSCTTLRKFAKLRKAIYPHFLHAYISNRLSSEIACSVRQLCTHITGEDDALLPTEPSLLSPLLSSLSDGGHLLYLPNKEDLQAGLIIINKEAVLSEINGAIFAPEYFKQHHDIATSTGVVPKSKVADVFAHKYNTDMILSVLTRFEFCEKIKDSFTLSLIANNKSLDLEDALHFEPYLGMYRTLIGRLFHKDLANQKVNDYFLHDLAESMYSKFIKEDPKALKMVLQMFNISDSRPFYSYFEQFPSEWDNPVMRCFRLLLTWKNCDTGGSTYHSLRTTLDKYSIFNGRNLVSI